MQRDAAALSASIASKRKSCSKSILDLEQKMEQKLNEFQVSAVKL